MGIEKKQDQSEPELTVSEERHESRRERRKKRKRRRNIVIVLVIVIIIIIAAIYFCVAREKNVITKEDVVTTSELEEVLEVGDFSVTKFVYKGIADYYRTKAAEKLGVATCNISYEATVKVGIDIEDIGLEVDKENKVVTVALPELTINGITIDEDSIDYMPQDPNIKISKVIALCKEDVETEAEGNEDLYVTAEDNLKSAIEGLLSPILENADYTLEWAEVEQEEVSDEE